MTKVMQLAKGLVALVVLTGLVVGVPWALWHFVGWPLPHHVPSAAQVGRALNRQGIPAQTLVDALAVVVWLTWATLVVSLVVEIPAALSGRHAPRLPIAGIFQPITGRLVAAVIVACLALAPRPAHPGAPGSAGSPTGPTGRRPVAALVIRDATLTARVSPVSSAPTTSAPAPPGSVGSPALTTLPASSTEPTTYVVQRGDTLWGIAQRELGDPLRWSEIYQLNEGRLQPGGLSLTDPHWIDPGWTLLLPTPPATAPPAPLPAPTTTTPAPTNPAPPAPVPVAPRTTSPATTSPTTTVPVPTSTAPASAPSATNGAAHHASSSSEPVLLPSGSVVAGSFAAGVLATVALGRLRRRHAYRYRPPEPGRDLSVVPLRPTLTHLAEATKADGEEDAVTAEDAAPAFPIDDDERRLEPGWLEVGTRGADLVAVEVAELSGTAFTGPTVAEVIRAIVAGLLVRAEPGATEILCSEELAERLFPGLSPDRALRRVDSAERAARVMEAERISRARRLASVDAVDAVRFRHDNPENPLPLLVVLLDDVPEESVGRWAALLDDAPRLGVAAVFLGDSPLATTQVDLDAAGNVTAASGSGVARALDGAALYRLRADEAAELLDAVNEANREPEDEREPEDDAAGTDSQRDIRLRDSLTSLGGVEHAAWSREEPEAQRWPEPVARNPTDGPTARPLAINVLGPYRITLSGQLVTSGLRNRAKVLLAWSLLRPEGATIEEIVDALWPKTTQDRVLQQFWHPLGDLRTFFRGPDDSNLEVLTKTGEHYRPDPDEITCDLWDFQAALGQAARADGNESARAALARAIDAYGGDLLAGLAYPWVEPIRQDLHRRAVDTHLRLAELEEHAGRPDAALDVLERAIALDRYAEEPYRRLMTLQAAQGRPDAVGATWQLLRRRLAELDVDIDDATVDLYHALTNPDPGLARPPIRLPS